MLKRTGVIIEKLMDKNAMLRIERRRLVEESVDALKQHLVDKKELVAARRRDYFPQPIATHQESRDERARSLSCFYFCPCVFRALPHVAFFNYVSKYVRQLLSIVIVLIFIMFAISRSRCYIGPSDLTSRSVQNFLFRFSFFSLKS